MIDTAPTSYRADYLARRSPPAGAGARHPTSRDTTRAGSDRAKMGGVLGGGEEEGLHFSRMALIALRGMDEHLAKPTRRGDFIGQGDKGTRGRAERRGPASYSCCPLVPLSPCPLVRKRRGAHRRAVRRRPRLCPRPGGAEPR